MHPENKATQSTPTCRGVRIFLGEDDREMRDLMAMVLRHHGYDVVEASNGLDLLREIHSHAPRNANGLRELVVTDVRMPGASGLDVLAWLRHSRPNLPVIIVTGFSDAELRSRARSLGAVAVIDKPFSLVALQAMILQHSAPGIARTPPANSNGVA